MDLFFGAFSAWVVPLTRPSLLFVCDALALGIEGVDARRVVGLRAEGSDARALEVAALPRATASRPLAGGNAPGSGSFTALVEIVVSRNDSDKEAGSAMFCSRSSRGGAGG